MTGGFTGIGRFVCTSLYFYISWENQYSNVTVLLVSCGYVTQIPAPVILRNMKCETLLSSRGTPMSPGSLAASDTGVPVSGQEDSDDINTTSKARKFYGKGPQSALKIHRDCFLYNLFMDVCLPQNENKAFFSWIKLVRCSLFQ